MPLLPSEDIFASFQQSPPWYWKLSSSPFGATFHFQMGCIVLLKVMICTSLGAAMYFLRYSVVALMFEWTPCLWCCAGQPNLHSPSNIGSVKYYFFCTFFSHTSPILFVDPGHHGCYQVWELAVIEATLVWHFHFFCYFLSHFLLFLLCSNTASVKHCFFVVWICGSRSRCLTTPSLRFLF